MSMEDARFMLNIICQGFANMLGIVGAMVFFGYQFWVRKEAVIGGGRLRRGLLVCFVLNAVLVIHTLILLPTLHLLDERQRTAHLWADIVAAIVVVILLSICTVGILIRVLARAYVNPPETPSRLYGRLGQFMAEEQDERGLI